MLNCYHIVSQTQISTFADLTLPLDLNYQFRTQIYTNVNSYCVYCHITLPLFSKCESSEEHEGLNRKYKTRVEV